jgi:hypothetical protein
VKRIRGGRGLGDSLYIRPFVEHFIGRGERITVLSDYPGVFAGTGAAVDPFGRNGVNVLAHYVKGKGNPRTTQWQDVCASVGMSIPLAIKWQQRNSALVAEVRAMAAGRPVVLVHGGRTPMGRTDGFGKELLPKQHAFEVVLGEFADCFKVRIGKGGSVYPLPAHLDLNDRTSVEDLLDLAQDCDGVIGQCSYAVPLAEVFGKPLLAVWAADGMAPTRHVYLRQITPRKVLSQPTSSFVMDSWRDLDIRREARAFRSIQ